MGMAPKGRRRSLDTETQPHENTFTDSAAAKGMSGRFMVTALQFRENC